MSTQLPESKVTSSDVLPDQQSKTKIYSLYNCRRLKKPANIHVGEAGTRECYFLFSFLN